MKEVKTLYVAEGEDGSRLDRFFKRRWPHVNHVQLNKLLRSGQIRVDGGRAKPDTRLVAGQQVRVPPLPEAEVRDPNRPDKKPALGERDIRYVKSMVLYEDDEVIALNKPSGLAVQGGTKTKHHIDRLLSAWGEGLDRPRLVHRLDRDTSGVLLLGKTPAAAARLAGSFAKRKAKKTYWALVVGNPHPAEGIIDTPLVKKGIHDREIVVPAEIHEMNAETAETEFVTIGRAAHRVSWMGLRPHTGRTHQLRAHMLAIGHPILGDPKYNDDASRSVSEGLGLQLHHRRIEIPHPSAGMLIVEAPLDPVIKAGFERFGFDAHDAEAEPFKPQKRGGPKGRGAVSLKLAVFDVDGTLVDSRAKIHQVLADAAQRLGHVPPTYDEARQIVGLSLFEAIRAMRPALDEGQVMAYVEAYKACYIEQLTHGASDVLYEGAEGLLSGLKSGGWFLGMATGNSRRGVDRLCGVFGWDSVFDARFCADDGPSKPHPHMLEANLKHTGTAPDQAVMIGDTSHDILMARAIGVHAVGVSWGFHTVEELRDCGADVIVHDFAELGRELARFEAELRVN